jgi:hypothetical protein
MYTSWTFDNDDIRKIVTSTSDKPREDVTVEKDYRKQCKIMSNYLNELEEENDKLSSKYEYLYQKSEGILSLCSDLTNEADIHQLKLKEIYLLIITDSIKKGNFDLIEKIGSKEFSFLDWLSNCDNKKTLLDLKNKIFFQFTNSKFMQDLISAETSISMMFELLALFNGNPKKLKILIDYNKSMSFKWKEILLIEKRQKEFCKIFLTASHACQNLFLQHPSFNPEWESILLIVAAHKIVNCEKGDTFEQPICFQLLPYEMIKKILRYVMEDIRKQILSNASLTS